MVSWPARCGCTSSARRDRGPRRSGERWPRGWGAHVDTDDFFWRPSEPKFQHIRERGERQALLGDALARHPAWVLSGSLCGWGDAFIPQFELVVFLWLRPEIRLARLRARERERYGDAIAPGGVLHERCEAFLAWAAGYDEGLDVPERCRRLHEEWLAALPCPVVRFIDTGSTEEHVAMIMGGVR